MVQIFKLMQIILENDYINFFCAFITAILSMFTKECSLNSILLLALNVEHFSPLLKFITKVRQNVKIQLPLENSNDKSWIQKMGKLWKICIVKNELPRISSQPYFVSNINVHYYYIWWVMGSLCFLLNKNNCHSFSTYALLPVPEYVFSRHPLKSRTEYIKLSNKNSLRHTCTSLICLWCLFQFILWFKMTGS